MILTASTLALAGVLGFSAHRASLCTVRAVEELLSTRRAYMLAGFAKTVLWVIGITAISVSLDVGTLSTASSRWALSTQALTGGLVFGVGAVLNGGCAISTLTRLADGNLGMLITLLGFCLGVSSYTLLSGYDVIAGATPASPLTLMSGMAVTVAAIVFGIWMFWEITRLWRTRERSHGWWARLTAERYRLSTAALLIGLSNAILYLTVGDWTYTHTLSAEFRAIITSTNTFNLLSWLLFASMLIGMGLSAWQRRQMHLRWRPRSQWWAYFGGGALMGVGAGLAPGGNDQLILRALPALSPHALPVFGAMIIGIAVVLIVGDKLGYPFPRVDCGGDVCRARG